MFQPKPENGMRRLMLTLIYSVLVLFNSAICSSADAQNNDIDSLFRMFELNNGNAIVFDKLDAAITGLFHNDTDKAMKLAGKMLGYARRSKNNYAEVKTMLNIGIAYDLKGNYKSALKQYNAALILAKSYKLKKLEGDIYNNFSITQAVIGNMEESVSNALKAMAIFEAENDSSRMAKIYNNLGSRYSEMGYLDEALSYYQKAALFNEKLNDQKKLAFNYGNIGLLLIEKKQSEKALEFFKKSMILQDTVSDKYNYAIVLHYLSLAYQQLAKFDLALKYEERSFELASEINDDLGRITSLNGLASINAQVGEKRRALQYYQLSAKIAEQIGARYYLINIYESIAAIYAELKLYREAFVFNEKYTDLKDSIMTSEKDKAVQKIKEYENQKTKQEIELLTKDSEIQKLKIRRQKILRNSISAVGILILMLAIGLLHRYRYVRKTRNELSEKNIIIHKEKERSDELLLNILPAETAEELKNSGKSAARHFEQVTVMFTDFKGFTFMAEKLSPQALVDEIDFCFRYFDQIMSKYQVEKIKTIGDAYMCAGGLPIPNTTNPHDVVMAAIEIQQFMEKLRAERKKENKLFFELRIGINTGPVVAGIVGTKKFQYDIWGDTVNVAARMESGGEVGKVNVSQSTYELIKDKFICKHRGEVEAKNKGAVHMYFVDGVRV